MTAGPDPGMPPDRDPGRFLLDGKLTYLLIAV